MTLHYYSVQSIQPGVKRWSLLVLTFWGVRVSLLKTLYQKAPQTLYFCVQWKQSYVRWTTKNHNCSFSVGVRLPNSWDFCGKFLCTGVGKTTTYSQFDRNIFTSTDSLGIMYLRLVFFYLLFALWLKVKIARFTVFRIHVSAIKGMENLFHFKM